MSERFHELSAAGIRLVVDLAVGHVRHFEVTRDGRTVAPLHTAPWVNDPTVTKDPEVFPNLKYLSGDFFCAPFGQSNVEAGSPASHGWPANSPWRLISDESGEGVRTARFALEHTVMGATVTRAMTVRDGHPFAYVHHTLAGGEGKISVASHGMAHFAAPGRLSFSPKAFIETPSFQAEPDPKRGHSVVAPGQHITDPTQLALSAGGVVDMHVYPLAERNEDFAMLVEAPDAKLGWTAAVHPDAGSIMLSLKNPRDYPVTFFWYSNGGRFYAPWNGRHTGVLGIEEGRAYSFYGHKASIEPNPLSDAGIPTSVTLGPDGTVSLHHVIGGMPLPTGWGAVSDITVDGDGLRITGDGGVVSVPFDAGFLA